MWRTVFNLTLLGALAGLGGCGMVQAVVDSTASAASAMFYKQVKTLHLDFDGRAAMNTDLANMSGLSVATLVRVYQLRDSKALEKVTYDNLLSQGDHVFRGDLLSERTIVIKPGEGVQLSIPLEQEAAFVAVVAMFRSPDTHANAWRLVLSRNDLDPDLPRVVALDDNRLTLRPQSKE